MRPFRGRFFRPRGIAEEGRNFAFWGDLAGFAPSFDLMSAFVRRAKQGRYSRFRYFPWIVLDIIRAGTRYCTVLLSNAGDVSAPWRG